MDPIEIMKRPAAYASGYENTPTEAQARPAAPGKAPVLGV